MLSASSAHPTPTPSTGGRKRCPARPALTLSSISYIKETNPSVSLPSEKCPDIDDTVSFACWSLEDALYVASHVISIQLQQLIRGEIVCAVGRSVGRDSGDRYDWRDHVAGPGDSQSTQPSYCICYIANTRSPEAPAAADIHLHVSPRPASASVCMCTAGAWARPAYTRLSRCSAMNSCPPAAQAAWHWRVEPKLCLIWQ